MIATALASDRMPQAQPRSCPLLQRFNPLLYGLIRKSIAARYWQVSNENQRPVARYERYPAAQLCELSVVQTSDELLPATIVPPWVESRLL